MPRDLLNDLQVLALTKANAPAEEEPKKKEKVKKQKEKKVEEPTNNGMNEFFEQLAVLLFGGDVHTRSQQSTGAADALGQRGQALCCGGHRGHGGRQASLHEFTNALGATDGRFAQLRDPLAHQLVIGCGGGKAKGVFGGDEFDRGGQIDQAVEHGLVLCGLALQRGRDVGQFTLGLAELHTHGFGHGQTAQGHESVGFKLQQALRNAPTTGVTGAFGGQHQHTFKTGLTQVKVGHHHEVHGKALSLNDDENDAILDCRDAGIEMPTLKECI